MAKADRLPYLPSVGFCLAAGALVALLDAGGRRTGLVLLLRVPALVALSVRTWVRNDGWRDNLTLGLATLRATPSSPLFHRIVGVAYRARGEHVRAHPHLDAAVQDARPENAGDHFNLANSSLSLGRFDEAERSPRGTPIYISTWRWHEGQGPDAGGPPGATAGPGGRSQGGGMAVLSGPRRPARRGVGHGTARPVCYSQAP